MQVSRAIPDLGEALFNFSDVNLAAVAATVRDSLARAALDGGGVVKSIRIHRSIVLLPRAHATGIEWAITMRGPRETAEAYADAQGRISYVDLKNTARARAINYLNGGKPLDEAIAAIHQAFGDERVFESVEILTPAYLMLHAKNQKEPHAVEEYTCDINGISRPLHAGPLPKPIMPKGLFAFKDMDWSRYEALKQAAIEKLGIPDGKVTSVEVACPSGPNGPQPMQWQINVRGQQEGSVWFNQQGAIVRCRMPRG